MIPACFYNCSRADDISKTSKLLYPLILDKYRKAELRCHWDDFGRCYCELPMETATRALTCSRQTAINAFRELERRKIIRRIQLEQGQNARSHVHYSPDFFDRTSLNP